MSVTGGLGRAADSLLVPVTILTPTGPQTYLVPLDTALSQGPKRHASHTDTQVPATHSQPFNPPPQNANTHTRTFSPSFQNANTQTQAFSPSTQNVDTFIQTMNARGEIVDTSMLQRLDKDAQEAQTHTQPLSKHTQTVGGGLLEDGAQVNIQAKKAMDWLGILCDWREVKILISLYDDIVSYDTIKCYVMSKASLQKRLRSQIDLPGKIKGKIRNIMLTFNLAILTS